MKFDDMNIDQKIQVSKLIESVRTARQIAFETGRDIPAFAEIAGETERLYVRLTALLGTKTVPLFDAGKHEANRIAEGHDTYADTPTKDTMLLRRLLAKGWDFTEAKFEDWDYCVREAQAWNFSRGDRIMEASTEEILIVATTRIDANGDVSYVVEGRDAPVPADDILDVRPLIGLDGALVIDEHLDLTLVEFSGRGILSDDSRILDIVGLPESPFMFEAGESSDKYELHAFMEKEHGVMLGHFIVAPLEDGTGYSLVCASNEWQGSRNVLDDARAIAARYRQAEAEEAGNPAP